MNKNYILLLSCLDFTSILFLLGFCGLLINKRNMLLMLLALELTFLASALNFICLGVSLNLITGPLYGGLVILVVITDTVMGLSLVILGYRSTRNTSLNTLCGICLIRARSSILLIINYYKYFFITWFESEKIKECSMLY